MAFKFTIFCFVLASWTFQHNLAQFNVNQIIDELLKADNVTDTDGGIQPLGNILASSQIGWLSRAEESLKQFVDDVNYNISEQCLQDTESLLAGLINREYWALRMLDAMGKPPSGLQDFHLHWVGNWEECMSVEASVPRDRNHRNGATRQLNGKYCNAAIKAKGSKAILGQGAYLRIGVCVPESCTNTDTASLVNALIEIIPINVTTLVEQPPVATCREKHLEFTRTAYISVIVCGVFCLIIAIATIYDVILQNREKQISKYQSKDENGDLALEDGKTNGINVVTDNKIASFGNGLQNGNKNTHPPNKLSMPSARKPGMAGKLLLSFSIYTNASKILNTNQSAGTLTAVNGIRFISMTWVVLGHTYSFGLQSASNIATFGSTLMKRFTYQAIENGSVSVDTFFTLSGLLVAYISFKELSKRGGAKKFNWGMFYFHRYWRLTPPYLLFMLLYVPTVKYWSDGPWWPQQGFEANNECKDCWWMNALYINNFFGMDKQCMGWTWYLNNDMQFYLISPLLMIPLFYSPIVGGIVCSVMMVAHFIGTGYVSYHYELKANVALSEGITSFEEYYMKPWCRIGPYIVGFITGYILYKTECKPKLTKLYNIIGWTLATTFGLMVVYGLYRSDGTEHLSTLTAAFYNATNRSVWGACVAWVVYACATGYGGPVNSFLSWRGLIPLSRLTYCCYLVHPVVMMVYYNSQRSLSSWSDINVSYLFLGHLCVTYAVAFVVSLAFESPMMGLEKVLFGKRKNK
ncbi:hypothetical protein ACF0H5_021989 [Mactra antiquata]